MEEKTTVRVFSSCEGYFPVRSGVLGCDTKTLRGQAFTSQIK